MGISHESLVSITEQFPEKTAEMKLYAEIEPPVTEEYLEALCEGDEDLKELFDEMLVYFYRYTRDVCEQESLKNEGITDNIEEIKRLDGPRTILHNTMIESVKIFARNLRKKGKDSSWIEGIDKKGRAGYAQLALLTTFREILSLNLDKTS
jgi:hypothetical protein